MTVTVAADIPPVIVEVPTFDVDVTVAQVDVTVSTSGPAGPPGADGAPGEPGEPGPPGDSMWTEIPGGIEYPGGSVYVGDNLTVGSVYDGTFKGVSAAPIGTNVPTILLGSNDGANGLVLIQGGAGIDTSIYLRPGDTAGLSDLRIDPTTVSTYSPVQLVNPQTGHIFEITPTSGGSVTLGGMAPLPVSQLILNGDVLVKSTTTLAGDPTLPMHAATKQYADTKWTAWAGSQAEYDALGTYDPSCLYVVV